MTRASAASDTGLPVSPSHIQPIARRGFLRQLASLPLVGGGVSLIGDPTAVAEDVTQDLLWGYKDWLFYEHRMLSFELADYDQERGRFYERLSLCSRSPASDWHFRFPTREGARLAGWPDAPQPSSRAALVLSAVGCNWRERENEQ